MISSQSCSTSLKHAHNVLEEFLEILNVDGVVSGASTTFSVGG